MYCSSQLGMWNKIHNSTVCCTVLLQFWWYFKLILACLLFVAWKWPILFCGVLWTFSGSISAPGDEQESHHGKGKLVYISSSCIAMWQWHFLRGLKTTPVSREKNVCVQGMSDCMIVLPEFLVAVCTTLITLSTDHASDLTICVCMWVCNCRQVFSLMYLTILEAF